VSNGEQAQIVMSLFMASIFGEFAGVLRLFPFRRNESDGARNHRHPFLFLRFYSLWLVQSDKTRYPEISYSDAALKRRTWDVLKLPTGGITFGGQTQATFRGLSRIP
jgi:hypothetical protein